jgi:hypothetical protein
LRPFGSIAYTHIPPKVSPSKLAPRSVKLTLIGYYNRSGYKLLDCSTGSVYKSQDVIFEETRPHFTTDPIVTFPSNDFIPPSDNMPIAPRPKQISTLHPPPTTPLSPPIATTPISPLPGPVMPPDDSEDEVMHSIMPGVENEPVATRRSKREMRMSTRMKESLEYLSRPTASLADVAGNDSAVPTTFNQAMKCPELWLAPMLKELAIMEEKQVFRLVPCPADKNVVKSKWVYANKYDDEGKIVDRKACLVAKGFTQILGEDYDETYASVARLELVRMVCAVAASLGLRLWQVNFVSAFLNSKNTFEIYMERPLGFDEGGDEVWLLLKTLYGTMQGAHDWAVTLERVYLGHGYHTSKADSQVQSK